MAIARPFYKKLRFILLLVLAIQVATLLVFIAFSPFYGATDLARLLSSSVRVSLQTDTFATLLGVYIASQFTAHPGVRAYIFTFPAMCFAFSILMLVVLYFRLDYSRAILAIGLILSNLVFGYYYYAVQRKVIPHYAIVRGGNLRGVENIKTATWTYLNAPRLDGVKVAAVVADLSSDLSPEWEQFFLNCTMAGIPVLGARYVYETHTGRVDVAHLSENTFGSTLPSQSLVRFKHAADVALGVIMLPFVAIIIAIAAVLIKIESTGPIFFHQQRVGYRGKPFTMWKLRSMYDGAHGGQSYTNQNDPRVTRVGKFIRKFHVDELPQILNILKGEMSWIGPRPEVAALVEEYSRSVPFHAYRHVVRPGLTGWAQVHQGNVGEATDEALKVSYDFYYIKNFSVWLDFLIVLKTLRTVLTGFGSL